MTEKHGDGRVAGFGQQHFGQSFGQAAGYQLHPELAAQQRKREERFLEGCGSAQIVSTTGGDALLIDGQVIEIRSSDPRFHVEMISKALRRGASDPAGLGEDVAVAPAVEVRVRPGTFRVSGVTEDQIKAEIDRIKSATQAIPPGAEKGNDTYTKLKSALRTLLWVLDPSTVRAPYGAIHGLPRLPHEPDLLNTLASDSYPRR